VEALKNLILEDKEKREKERILGPYVTPIPP
jgi:hypothetical protein